MKFCECGCGQEVKPEKRFINGHNMQKGRKFSKKTRMLISKNNGKKRRRPLSQICICGCGEATKPGKQYVHGHNVRGKPGWSKGLTGETHPGLKLSGQKRKGIQKAWNKGRKATEEERLSNSEAQKKWLQENPERLEDLRKRALERNKDSENKKKVSNTVKALWQDPEYRKILRLAHTERIRRQKQQPSYNEKACEFFEQFDKDFCTGGQYATNGGEFYIKRLGYWLDYINFNLKLIIEWDEEHHYDAEGNLREMDIRRQNEIQEHFPDFKFIRLRENKLPETLLGFPVRYVE